MSETQAAMREYRFLDDKRRTGGLSADEEQRWHHLGVSLGIIVPPEPEAQPEGAGQWGADGLWYPAPLPYEQVAAGAWDPGALGLGYDPNSGAWWDPNAQAWYQPEAWPQGSEGWAQPQSEEPQAAPAALQPEQPAWAAPALPAEKSVGTKAPWRSVTEAAPAPEPQVGAEAAEADDGPMEVSDDEVMEVSDDEVELVSEEAPPPPPPVKVPAAPKEPPPAPAPAPVFRAPGPPSKPDLGKMPSSGLFDSSPVRPAVPKAPEPLFGKPAEPVKAPALAIPKAPEPLSARPARPPEPAPLKPPAPPPPTRAPEPPPPPPGPIALEPEEPPATAPAPVESEPVESAAVESAPVESAPVESEPTAAPAGEAESEGAGVFVVRGTGSAAPAQDPRLPIPLTQVKAPEPAEPAPPPPLEPLVRSAPPPPEPEVPSIVISPELLEPAAPAPPPEPPAPAVEVSPDLFAAPPPEPEPAAPSVEVSPDLFAAPPPEPELPAPSVEVSPDLFAAPPSEPEPAAPSVEVSPDLFAAPPPEPELPAPSVEAADEFLAPPADALGAEPPHSTDPFGAPTEPAQPAQSPADDFFAGAPAPEPVPAAEAAEPLPEDDFFGAPAGAVQPPPPPPPSIPDAPASLHAAEELEEIPLEDEEPLPAPMPSAPLPITVDDAEFRAAAAAPPNGAVALAPPMTEAAPEEDEPVLQGTLEGEELPPPPEPNFDLSGSADEKVELASTADFVTGQFGEGDKLNVSDQFSDGGEMVLENVPAAMLANQGVDFSASGHTVDDDAPIPLANNADFLDNPELTGTGEAWQRTGDSMALNDWDADTVQRQPAAPAPAPAAPEPEPEPEEELVMGEILEDEPEPEQAAPPPPPPPRASGPAAPLGFRPGPAKGAPLAPAAAPARPAVAPGSPLTVAAPVRPASAVKPLVAPRSQGGLSGAAANLRSSIPPAAASSQSGPLPNVPVVLDGEHRVIVHTVEGQVKRGALKNQDLGGRTIELHGTVHEQIPLARVKAIFFMLAPGAPPPVQDGKKVRVTFRDGRQVAGFSRDHDKAALGLFVVPADNRTNTARIFVYRHAVQSIGVD